MTSALTSASSAQVVRQNDDLTSFRGRPCTPFRRRSDRRALSPVPRRLRAPHQFEQLVHSLPHVVTGPARGRQALVLGEPLLPSSNLSAEDNQCFPRFGNFLP